MANLATVWSELFCAEQSRIVQLLVERVDVQEEALEVRIRADGSPLCSPPGAARGRGATMPSSRRRSSAMTPQRS
jgi:hypothetical protein